MQGPSLQPPFVLLEDRLDLSGQALLFEAPQDLIVCDRAEDVTAAFARIKAGLDSGLHAAGFLAYELGYVLEPRLAALIPPERTYPLLWMGLFAAPRRLSRQALDEMFARLGPPPPLAALRLGHDRATHVAKAQRVLELIAAGDVYQANLTFPIDFHYTGDPLALYGALRVRQPVGHGGVAAFAEATVLSVSPELFLSVVEGRAVSRPMKGTTSREANGAADATAMQCLASDPKQRAENLMIVDLIRNDLARISTPGTVCAPDLFTVETYPTFHSLTSTVASQLRPGLGLGEMLGALFPCGSIVGAPKIRAAQVLRELEPTPRGVYTGSLGMFAPDGRVELNVAIRTAMVWRDGQGRYGVGGGVVADSDPDAEYDEALLKARVLQDLSRPYDLLETFRWSSLGGFVRLDRHMDRLQASSAQLGFAFDRPAAMAELEAVAAGWSAQAYDRRVRLNLAREGRLTIGHAPAPDAGPQRLRIGLVAERLDPGDPFLRHKTTCRDAYDRAGVQARAAGLDEGILLNRYGDVADGVRSSIFLQLDGRLVTPPLTAGALPGVLRAALIEEKRAVEGRLTPDTLGRAEAVFVGNSLRGLQAAVVAPCEQCDTPLKTPH